MMLFYLFVGILSLGTLVAYCCQCNPSRDEERNMDMENTLNAHGID